ncbi:MAG: 4Fe-4S binding protein [Planctomycetota bacterium]|nr:4Fe-4S binding protein [Planctomycetota bacterium]
MTSQLEPLLDFLTPLTSPFLAVVVILSVRPVLERFSSALSRAFAFGGVVGSFFLCYKLLALNEAVAHWLSALNTPLVTVLVFVVLPAMYLPRNRYYKYFLLLPAVLLVLGIADIFRSYAQIPQEHRGFYWFLIRPAYLMGMVAGVIVLVQPFLSMKWFRRAVRLSLLLVLLYGGFAFRTSYVDYQQMLERRTEADAAVMTITDTVPSVNTEGRMLYLPSAPCRFSADGGYVQGCNIELFQRVLQLDFSGAISGDPNTLNTLSVLSAAALLFLLISFLFARIACGWLCPLSTLGDIVGWARKKLGLPYYKPSKTVKVSAFAGGLSIAGLTFLMAKAVPHLDKDGAFLGCKIPSFPFCKVCPAQQVCPVASGGIDDYPPLPGTEWAFGFFRYGSLLILAFFLLAFIAARRLWCRFCPMGMISGVFNRGGMVRLKKNPLKCNSCGVCEEVCPMDISLVRKTMDDRNVSSYDCLLCGKCVEKCPRDGCLTIEHAGVDVCSSRFRSSNSD